MPGTGQFGLRRKSGGLRIARNRTWFENDNLFRGWTVPADALPYLSPTAPLRRGGGTLVGSVSNGSNIVLTMPPIHVRNGVVTIHSSRNSNVATATISDSSGATWTVANGPTSANSSSAHYVWQAPWTVAMIGATVTIVWTSGQNGAAAAEVWEGVAVDALTVATAAGDGTAPFNETAPAHTAGGTDSVVLAMGGGRGVNDDSQPTLDTSVVPSGWSNLQQAKSAQSTGTARNVWAWSASKIVTGSASIASEVFTDTLATNSRFAVTISMLPVTSGNGSVSGVAAPMSLPSTAANTIIGGAVVVETAGAMSLPSTSPNVGVSDFVTVTANGMSLPSVPSTIIGGARVVETPGTMSLPATNPSSNAGAVVTVTASGMSLPSTSPTIGSVGNGVVSATAAPMAFPSTNVEVSSTYFAIGGEMVLGQTAPTIIGTSPNGTVVAVAATATFPWAFPEVEGYGPPAILVRLKNTDVGNFIDVPRPLPPSGSRWVGLWPRLVLPATQKALLLFQDGTVQEVTSLMGDIYDLADDVIAGGTVWEGLSTSWQAQALAAAGYTLVPVEEA